MSRFFRSASDSESESDFSDDESFVSDEELESSEAEDSSDEDNNNAQPKKSRFLKDAGSDSDEDSDEDEGDRRQIKSQKSKRFDELMSSAKAIESSLKTHDWHVIAGEFDKLTIGVTKATTGFDQIPIPKFFIKTVVDLDEAVKETAQKEKGTKKKMSSANSKSLNVLKQKLKKTTKQYDSQIAEFKKDPEAFMAVDEDEAEPQPVERKVTPKVTVAETSLEGFATVGKSGKAIPVVTTENLFVRLREVLENRGKKNTDRDEQTLTLEKLLSAAKSSFQKIMVLLVIIPSRFDIHFSMVEHMQVEAWKKVEKEINMLLEILEKDTSFVVRDDASEIDHDDKDIIPAKGEVVSIRGSIISLIERLDDEFTKSLLNIDPHTPDYIDRLRDEPGLYALLVRAQAYFEKYKMQESISRIITRRLEHLYYKPEQVIRSTEASAESLLPNYISSDIITAKEPSQVIHQLCTFLYKQDTSVLRTRAMLCHIYHHALHKRFHTARDMLLMSHLQETIHQADVATQVLYNRAVAQIGLCAFREGLIKEAHACLQELQGSNRVKELLAQGIQAPRFGQQTTPEIEQLERQRQLPFHMHINLELLECVFLTCSMLLEIPAQAQAGPNNKKMISRPFRRLLDYNERQAFSGPPENTRDHIMSAAKALASGEWERARDYILSIKIWNLMPENQKIKDMLVSKIQEEGLCTYLFTYASYYSTLGLKQLSDMFDLPVSRVTTIVAKLIWNEELSASLDQVSQCVVLHRVEPSQLQMLALQYSEKVANLVDQNERLVTAGRDKQ